MVPHWEQRKMIGNALGIYSSVGSVASYRCPRQPIEDQLTQVCVFWSSATDDAAPPLDWARVDQVVTVSESRHAGD